MRIDLIENVYTTRKGDVQIKRISSIKIRKNNNKDPFNSPDP